MNHQAHPSDPGIGNAPAFDVEFRDALRRIGDILLAGNSLRDQWENATQQLFRFCVQHSGLLGEQPSRLPSGIAVSPADAANCVLDVARTRGLLLGVDRALRVALARFDERPIRVLYAGCGPFAPLALPLACRYSPTEAVFHLVDVHGSALSNASALFACAGAGESLVAAQATDAANLRLETDERPHILVAELMQRALSREPQIAVLRALWPQCRAGALLVPHSIEVRAVLMRMPRTAAETPRIAMDLGTLIDVSIERQAQWLTSRGSAVASLPPVGIALSPVRIAPPRVRIALSPVRIALSPVRIALSPVRIALSRHAPAGCLLALCTRIETFAGHFIGDFESGLTQPQILFHLGTVAPGSEVEFTYRLGEQPGFECRYV